MNAPAFQATPERILQRLDWHVIRRLDGILQGDYRSLFHGFGLDFSDLRAYQVEDDIRYIDWNVTARMNAPFIRQYHEDREITAWFLLDISPSMDFGSFDTLKRIIAQDLVAVLARLLTRHGNRVGAIFHDGVKGKMIPARGGKLQTLLMIHELLRQQPQPRASLTNLSALLDDALHAIKRRSLIFIVSDFISTPGWERKLRLLSHRHEVIGVHVLDRAEMDLPDAGLILLRDAETGEQLYVDTHDRAFRERFSLLVDQRRGELAQAFNRAGSDLLKLSTDEDLVRAILRFVALRRRRGAM